MPIYGIYFSYVDGLYFYFTITDILKFVTLCHNIYIIESEL